MAGDRGHRVVVIGGGVIGLATAVTMLRRSPDVLVTVLEKEKVGGGASAYAGAIDIPYCNSESHRQLVKASWTWHDASGAAAEYRRPVPITWYAGPGEAESSLRRSVLPPLHSGGSAAWPAPDGVAAYSGRAFLIDWPSWCRALVREIEQSGRGEIHEQTGVVATETTAARGRVGTVVRCDGGRVFEAAYAVVCLGPWLPGWSEPAGAWSAARQLRTKRVAGLNIDIHSDHRPQHAVAWPDKDMHFHPAFDGGGYRLSFRHPEWDVDPDQPASSAATNLDAVNQFLDGLLGAGGWSVSGERVFVDTYTPDLTPIVERCPPLGNNVTVVTGTRGSGIRLAPGIADLAARQVLTGLENE